MKLDRNINIFNYLQIKIAIPYKWKTLLRDNTLRKLSNLHKLIYKDNDLSKLYNKNIYNIIMKQNQQIPPAQDIWVENYPYLVEANWESIYKLAFKTCSDTYVQSLQYKILNRYVNCNENLYKWKIKDSPLCSYCDQTDNLEHFFIIVL